MQISQFLPEKTFVRRSQLRLLSLLLLLTLLILGSSGSVFAQGSNHNDDHGQNAGAVYVMNNDATDNAIIVFDRAADGTLAESGTFSTGGQGTGSGLGSQGAIALSRNRQWLFAVNAGSNEISVFNARGRNLNLVDTVPSGGEMPTSLTVHGRILYVLNAGGSGNITGFYIGRHGHLFPIPHSTRNLSNDGTGAAPGPAQVSFTPNGRQLVVTEKATNLILTYRIRGFGRALDPVVHDSEGQTPFGFDFTPRGVLIVSEAFGGAENASAASSYSLKHGQLQAISSSVPTNQTAACWVVVTKDGKYAYTTNTGSSSVSGYQVNHDGSISLLDASGVTGETGPGSKPIDAIISRNGRYLYVLSSGSYTVTAFHIGDDGSLVNLGDVTVPAGTVGITAN
ncbi:MAG: beta-propeller fold lactonase family protein [Anaerolineae bacterium]